ncbi:MAG: hypothetical protein COA92_06335 [Sulfurovum sp.]|nr:MAG: hypothetical protein COA92_06335 [Sulfurovum sp.]
MKKLGLGIIGLIIVGAIYYFTVGSTKLTAELKTQVTARLSSLQKEGFSIQNREVKENQEHFNLSFDDPQKITHFLNQHGVQITLEDAKRFKGLILGVDVHYLPDAYTSVSFDAYPTALPAVIMPSATNADEKQVLAQVEKILEKKSLLMHVAINKLGTGFKGDMRDIDEILKGKKDIQLTMESLTFSGDIKDDAIYSVKQNLKTFSAKVPDVMFIAFKDLTSDYKVTGKTSYDYHAQYSVANMTIDIAPDLSIVAKNMTMSSTSFVKDALVSGTMTSKVERVDVKDKDQAYALNTLVFDINAGNLDINAFEKLQQADVNDKKLMNDLMQQFFAKGVYFEIPAFSVDSIENDGKKLKGFTLNAKVNLDKSFDIMALDTNPMSVLTSMDANLNLSFSQDLLDILSQQPQAMMTLMIFQPKDVNGTKVYELKLQDGKLTVNGMSM